MGSGMVQCWINGPATSGIDDKIKMVRILLNNNIPSFHSSIIPLFHFRKKFGGPKNLHILSGL